MKIPKEGDFFQEEGSIYAQNNVTNDEVIFFADESQNLCFRSMMEEDVHAVMDSYGANSRRRKALKKVLAEKNSQLFNFVIEEVNLSTENGNRKIIGDCQIDENGSECSVQLYIKNFRKDANYVVFLGQRALAVVNRVLKELGLEITPKVSRVSKKY